MALSRTDVGIYKDSSTPHGTSSFSTSAFTPPDNSLLVISVALMGLAITGDLGTPTIDGGGLTYTPISGATVTLSPTYAVKMVAFTAPVTTGASMTITVDDDNNQNIFGYEVEVTAWTGYDTSTPITGVVSSTTTDIADGAESRTLAATPATDDVTLVFCICDADGATANPTLAAGWTKIHDSGSAGGGGTMWNARRESSTSTTVSVTDIYTGTGSLYKAGLYAFIVKAAATDLPQTIRPDADTTTTGWTTTPLWSKISDSSDATVISATLA